MSRLSEYSQDAVIYGQRQLSGLLRELLQAQTQLINEAKVAGFDTLRITGRWVPGSSSAHPGKAIDVTIDLKKYAGD